MKWYENSALIGFFGVFIGALISMLGTIYSSRTKLKEINKKYYFDLEQKNREKETEICIQIIQSLYSLQKMNENLIKQDIKKFREESYTIMAIARIYCSDTIVNLYEYVLNEFFNDKIYDGKTIDTKLIPEIRKDLNISSNIEKVFNK